MDADDGEFDDEIKFYQDLNFDDKYISFNIDLSGVCINNTKEQIYNEIYEKVLEYFINDYEKLIEINNIEVDILAA